MAEILAKMMVLPFPPLGGRGLNHYPTQPLTAEPGYDSASSRCSMPFPPLGGRGLRTIPHCNTFLNHHRFLCQVCVFSPYDLRTESASTVRVKKHSDDRIILKYTRVQNSCSCYPAPLYTLQHKEFKTHSKGKPWALFNLVFKTRQGPQENKKNIVACSISQP
jgi:hypothetical protein